MADLEIRDTAGTAIVAIGRMFGYPWPRGWASNVAAGDSLGGKVKTTRRGLSRRTMRLSFVLMGATQAGQMDEFIRGYAGRVSPCVLNFNGNFKKAFDGSWKFDGSTTYAGDFRCRLVAGAMQQDQTQFQRYAVALDLIQDLV